MLVNPWLRLIAQCYGWVIWIGEHLQSLFLLLLRLTWGHQFFLSGYEKLSNKEPVIQYFTTLGIPNPEFHVLLVGFTELVGGLLLFIGLGSRLAAIPLIFTMFSALGFAHTHIFEGFEFIKDPLTLVHEAPFPFLITSLIVLLFGPGRISCDAWIKRRSKSWERF